MGNSGSAIYFYKHKGRYYSRYQVLDAGRKKEFDFLAGPGSGPVMPSLASIASRLLLPKKPEVGVLVLFRVTDDMSAMIPDSGGHFVLFDLQAKTRRWFDMLFREGAVRINDGRLVSDDPDADRLITQLEERNLLYIVESGNPGTVMFVPVSDKFRFLSSSCSSDSLVFNTHFFLLDLADLETDFDIMGEPFGLLMLNGRVILPPLYSRSALFAGDNGASSIIPTGIKDTGIIIDKTVYKDGDNCSVMVRPDFEVTPLMKGGVDLAVVGNRIAGLSHKGGLQIPEAGFVVRLHNKVDPSCLKVGYTINSDLSFGIQAGPPLIKGGKMIDCLEDPYYQGAGVKYPPAEYPRGWAAGRAARLGMGISKGHVKIVWGEGDKSVLSDPDSGGKGFSLEEFAEVAESIGFDSFINLDGGGSAQALLRSARSLKISDRVQGIEVERPVPVGLSVKI